MASSSGFSRSMRLSSYSTFSSKSLLSVLLATLVLSIPTYAQPQAQPSTDSNDQFPTPTVLSGPSLPTDTDSFDFPSSATGTATSSSAQSTPTGNDNDRDSGGITFNYFFLLIAVAGILLVLSLLFFSRRRKMKRNAAGLEGRTALARDLERWAGRQGYGPGGARVGVYRGVGVGGAYRGDRYGAVNRREPGLDEHGEAPPSYEAAEADKPPSLRGDERIGVREVRGSQEGASGIELGTLPPDYDAEHRRVRTDGMVDVELARPEPARVAEGRWTSMRRFMPGAGGAR